MKTCSQTSASIQPRTSHPKFDKVGKFRQLCHTFVRKNASSPRERGTPRLAGIGDGLAAAELHDGEPVRAARALCAACTPPHRFSLRCFPWRRL